jgi:hypothetical protein
VNLEEARRLLGLGDGPLTIQELRAARNSALKAHHPDLTGADEATRRRATYWSSQINRAFEVLEGSITGPAAPKTGDHQRQSFSAAANRASNRASQAAEAEAKRDAEKKATEAKAARDAQAAAAQRAAEQRARREAQARAAEKKAAEAHAAREAAAAAPPKSPDGVSSPAKPAQRLLWAGLSSLEHRGVVALGLFLVLLVPFIAAVLATREPQPASAAFASSPLAGAAAGNPQASAGATPAPTPRPTPRPSPSPTRAVFDWWATAYRSYVSPCYSSGPCDLAFDVTYDDGTRTPFAKEVERLAELYRDNLSLNIGAAGICEDTRGAMFALYAAMAAEVDLVGEKRSSETPLPGWRPSLGLSYAECGAAPGTTTERRAALKATLEIAKSALVRAKAFYTSKDWDALRETGLGLAEIGTDLARSTARDLTVADPWQDARWIALTALKVSGRLEIQRLAAAPATAATLEDLIARVDGVLDKLT